MLNQGIDTGLGAEMMMAGMGMNPMANQPLAIMPGMAPPMGGMAPPMGGMQPPPMGGMQPPPMGGMQPPMGGMQNRF